MNRGSLLSGAGLFLLAASVHAATGSVEMRLRALESRIPDADRLAALEKSLDAQGAGVMAGEVTQLKSEVRELRGQIEQLTHELQKQQQSQRQLYNDIDRRLQGMEARASSASVVPELPSSSEVPIVAPVQGSASASTPAAGDDRSEYLAAFDALQQGKTGEAIPAFQRFLERHPNSSYTSNAVYWLGEAHYVSKNYPQAVIEFQKLIAQYPQSTKVSGALLKLGYIHYETRNFTQAREVLESVKTRYPDSKVSTLATERLERMRKEGV